MEYVKKTADKDSAVKQSNGTTDVVISIVKESDLIQKHKIAVVVDSDDGLIDSSSDNLVIADATVIETKNPKHVTFCYPGDEIGTTDKLIETEETVDIDTMLDTNTTLDTNVDTTLETVETPETGNGFDGMVFEIQACKGMLSKKMLKKRNKQMKRRSFQKMMLIQGNQKYFMYFLCNIFVGLELNVVLIIHIAIYILEYVLHN